MTKIEEARRIDQKLKQLVRESRKKEAEAARLLLRFEREHLYRALGYARIQDYAAFELELPRGKARELLEIADKARSLPELAKAFESGEVPWTKCRQVVRVATKANEGEWLARARKLTSRELEREVARAKGQRPLVRIVLELTEEDAADLDEAVRALREEREETLTFPMAVAELARRSQGSPENRPGYQVVIQECPTCGAASRDAREATIPVSKQELEAAKVDAEIVDLRRSPALVKKTITPAERREVVARDRGRCGLCGTRAWLHIHHVRQSGTPSALTLLCSLCHKRLVHEGHVAIYGNAPGLRFALRDGSAPLVFFRGTG
jgi:hypothetical protein